VSFAVSLSQLLLAVVFAVAAVAKLADRPGTRRAIEAFGAPPRSAAAGSLLLPVAELAIAAALVPAATARWGALAAVALLVIFSVAIARTLRAGSAPDCNCFGGLTQTEVGRGTLIRNLLLGGIAAFVALSGEPVGAFHWVTIPAARDRMAIVFMIVCLAGLGWLCWQLLRQNGRLLLRLEAEGAGSSPAGTGAKALPPLEPGTPAPRFAGRDLHGEPVSLDSLLAAGRPVALFFTDPGCGACESALDVVARAQRERADELTLAVISSGSIDRIEEKATQFGLDRVVPQGDQSLFDAYRVYGVPGVVEIDETGALSRPAALGIDAVRDVVLGTAPGAPRELGLVAR
jgi:peroxiredoxin